MKQLYFAILAFLLASCAAQPNEALIKTSVAEAIAQTQIAATTDTPEPSPSPTETALPTVTSTATITATPTDTATPIPPPQLTATSVASTQQEKYRFATATESVKVTRVVQTKVSKEATATKVAMYKEINFRELVNYADNHIGEFVIVRGRVFNVNSNTEFQMFFAGTYEAAYIIMSTPYKEIYDGTAVVVYGIAMGKECFKNAYGAEICQPLIKGSFFGKQFFK